MRTQDFGRYLARGGEAIRVDRAPDAITARLAPDAARRLAAVEPAIAAAEPLTGSVARLALAEPTARDDLMDRLREDDGIVVHHEYVATAGGTPVRITDELIVAFAPGVDADAVAAALDAAGVHVKKPYPELGNAWLVTVTAAAGANPLKVANRLQQLREVVYAEPAIVNRFELQSPLPTDPQLRDQWHLASAALAGPDVVADADASVAAAWELEPGRREVVVALLDDGFDLTHPDFQGEGKVVEAVDFRGGDASPLPEGSDYHGTPCAGVAVAEANGDGCVGAAPGCALMPVRFPLSAQDPWLIEIFRHVSARAHVMSCSWGPPPGNAPLHSAVRDTIAQLAASGGRDGRGLVICFAAGNYDAPLDATVTTPVRWATRDAQGRLVVNQASGRIVNGFAAHPDVIAVSACTSLNRKSAYSNWGPQVTLCAPSNNWHPLTLARLPGRGITTTDNEAVGRGFTPGKRYTNSFGGTSSATPLAAGIAALVRSANRSLTARQVAEILRETATPIVDPSVDEVTGLARGTYVDGRSDWFGHGKANARAAGEAALARAGAEGAVEAASTTRRAIPDGQAAGIATSVAVAVAGVVVDLAVEVAIAHPWVGDLEVELVAPSGARAWLHRRTGAGADDLRRTFAPADTAALAVLLGEEAAGQWTLRAADRATRDTGTLEGWALRLVVRTAGRTAVRSARSVEIPDADPAGVTSGLDVPVVGAVAELAVSLDVTHPFVGDLVVTLAAPDGTSVVLQARQGGAADNLVATYTAATTPALAALVGRRAHGRWALTVADAEPRDAGKLNAWGLDLTVT
ncbi:MAG: S8 family serine peptidase [Thermoleophilia bacterium]